MKRLIGLILLLGTGVAGAAQADDSSINLRRTITVEVVEKTKNSVVFISSSKIVTQRVNPFGNDPFWEQFGQMRRFEGTSLGSGFIVHPEGYIITNNHVIDRARQINVELLDGRKFEAEIISADAESDLAVLKINHSEPFPALPLGDSGDLMIGEPVIAVGNPLGFSHSVSTGIVSAIHRDLTAGNEQLQLTDLIQTDAAINPGNSGGPLLNAYGQVIGINTAIRGDAQNIGFAIQVNRLRDLIPKLMSPALVTKLDLPLSLKEQRTVEGPAKVNVQIVRANDGAAVRTIAGNEPANIVDAYAMLLKQRVDEPFEVALASGEKVKIEPKALPLPDAIVQAKQKLGITVEPLTPMLAQRLNLPDVEEGMLITEITRGSPADQATIRPGDVIRQIGQYRVSNIRDFGVLLQHLPEHGQVMVGIQRGRATGFVRLKL